MSDQWDDAGINDAGEINIESIPEETEVSPDLSEGFQLETDLQINDAVGALSQMEQLDSRNWEGLDVNQRLETLQHIEDRMAEIQGRPAMPVTAEEMKPGRFGYFDGEGIKINTADLAGNEVPVAEHLDTIVHEGRHAFQQFAIANPEVVSDPNVVSDWAINMEPGNYLSLQDYGPEIYQSQPVEADAWNFAGQIRQGIFGQGA